MQMNLLAVVGSPRKGKATDLLVDSAIEGAREANPSCNVKKLHLIDYDIQSCRNCLACRDSPTDADVAPCSIDDDMKMIAEDVLNSDALIFGTPVHMGYATGILTTFLNGFAGPSQSRKGRCSPSPAAPCQDRARSAGRPSLWYQARCRPFSDVSAMRRPR